jgi:hypothetical protein
MSDATSDNLNSVTETGRPTNFRVASAAAAYSIYDDFNTKGEEAARRRARVKGLIDGNRPFNDDTITRLGQSWRANFNTRESRAMVNQAVGASWDLQFEVPVLAEFKMDPRVAVALKLDPEVETMICDVVSEEYTHLLQSWHEFYLYSDQTIRQATELGFAGMFFADPWDWRPKPFRTGCLKVKDWASVLASKQDVVCLDDSIPVTDLFDAIEDETMAKEMGWKPAAVRELLVSVFRGGEQPTDAAEQQRTSPWESLQQAYKNGEDVVTQAAYQDIQVVRMFVKERIKGKWLVSYLVISRNQQQEARLLFERRGLYESMDNWLWLLPYEYGDGYLRSSKGLGTDIFAYCEYSNRFVCQSLDGALLGGSLLLQPNSGFDTDKLSVIRMGMFTYLPPELKVVAGGMAPNINGLIQMRSVFKDITENNTGINRLRSESNRDAENPKTARQIVYEEGKEARVEKSRALFYSVQWTLLHREIFRRLVAPGYVTSAIPLPGASEARSFVERCVARGVPLPILLLPGTFEITATQSVGLGSYGARMDITNQFMAARSSMSERGRKYTQRLWAATRAGSYRIADRLFPLEDTDNAPTRAQSWATLENNDFSHGQAVPAGLDDPHVLHLPVHFKQLMGIAQMFKEDPRQMDMQAALATFSVSLPHCEQHIGYLAQDPSRAGVVEQFSQIFQGLSRVAKALESAAAAVMQSQRKVEQQRNEMLDAGNMALEQKKLEIEAMKARGKLEVEANKQGSIMEMRQIREEHQQALKSQSQQFEQQLAAAKQAFEADLARFKAQQEIEIKRMKENRNGG